MKQIDKKGLFWFLTITFTSTILVSALLWLNGFSLADRPWPLIAQYTLLGVMFIPGLSALIVRKFITKEGFTDAGLNLGARKFYLQTYILIPILFVIAYGLTAVFIAKPDFSLTVFANQYGLIIFGSLTWGPIINSFPAFGEEFGWRGFLLPKLLPLGKVKALFLSGFIWGLWHAPFVLLGLHYGDQRLLGAIMFAISGMLLGVYIGYLRLVSGSVFLASLAHGIFNAQFYGVWMAIFPTVNPLLGGMTGITGMFVLLLVMIWIIKKELDKI